MPESNGVSDNVEPALVVKLSDLVLHLVTNTWGTLLGLGLRFPQECRTCNSVKERDPICTKTTLIAQH